jgi:hypothetical protein
MMMASRTKGTTITAPMRPLVSESQTWTKTFLIIVYGKEVYKPHSLPKMPNLLLGVGEGETVKFEGDTVGDTDGESEMEEDTESEGVSENEAESALSSATNAKAAINQNKQKKMNKTLSKSLSSLFINLELKCSPETIKRAKTEARIMLGVCGEIMSATTIDLFGELS